MQFNRCVRFTVLFEALIFDVEGLVAKRHKACQRKETLDWLFSCRLFLKNENENEINIGRQNRRSSRFQPTTD
ncbi:hypothetical protein [Undibacterium sp.]|uniref:hypothetical protein n=1 Tax=Undibacterium sp. TaxID=1914977 RepID=UPI0025F3AD43|nr:hypothetical protein [Undibacterium sp.]